MAKIDIDGVRLHVEEQGAGEPVVLVHGSWDDTRAWQHVAPRLAASHRVITYDRRGHTRSGRPDGVQLRRRHEDDLAAIIERVAGGPAFVVGNSYGGLVALGLAGRRPDLVTGVAVHEPPALAHATDDDRALLGDAGGALGAILAGIAAGEIETATEQFMEEIALGPGSWALIPPEEREIFFGNAPAFAADMGDPAFGRIDPAALTAVAGPVIVSQGDQAPPLLRRLADRLGEVIPGAEPVTIAGAGHSPQDTHPVEYAALIAGWARPARLAA